MKTTYLLKIRRLFITTILTAMAMSIAAQTSMPPELSNSSIKEQLNYLEQKTRIYEFYRAIREDMFQKIKINVNDTLAAAGNSNMLLRAERSLLRNNIDSLNTLLETTKVSLEEMTRTKNSIKVIGIEVNKTSYNSIMWILIASLLAILAIGFLTLKRNISLTLNRKKEIDALKNEFEAYRKTTREAREKMSMEHFKEIQRLKNVQQ